MSSYRSRIFTGGNAQLPGTRRTRRRGGSRKSMIRMGGRRVVGCDGSFADFFRADSMSGGVVQIMGSISRRDDVPRRKTLLTTRRT